MNADTIRSQVQADPRTHDAYAPATRVAVGRYAKQRRAEGARWTQIADEAGVSTTSARTWMLAVEAQGFRQVVLVDDSPVVEVVPADELVITSPLGFTLTGCTLEQAVAVLRSLA